MSAPAIISGDLTTFKHVPTRKVYQLIVEIPAEAASAAFATLGMPGTVSQIPVAVARLVSEYATPDVDDTSGAAGATRRPFADLPYPQQAALRCGELDFQRFIQQNHRAHCGSGPFASNSDAAATAVRSICGVTSRADIGKGPNDRSVNDSGFKWRALDAEYYAWQRGRR